MSETKSEMTNPVDTVVIKRWVYFYKQNDCAAYKADEDKCICWHDEGVGPYPNARHDEENTVLNWKAL